MRQNILYVITSSGWGGAELYVSTLAKQALESYSVFVLTGSYSTSNTLLKDLAPNIRSGKLRHLKRNISPFEDLLAIKELKKFIDDNSIDIVHSNSSKAGLIGALASRFSKRKPKVVYTAHGWGFLEDRSWFFKKAVLLSEKIASKNRSQTIVLSDMEKTVAIKNNLANEKNISLIPLGIDPETVSFLERESARKELGLGGTIIGTIANAYPAKALDILVSAFDKISEKFSDLNLVIIGDGPEMEKLKTLKESLTSKDRIFLLGNRQGASKYIRAFDIFAMSSTKEGFPWVILEASLAECPIIATKVGALPEIIKDGENGVLVEPGDIAELAEAFTKMIENKELYSRIKNEVGGIARLHPAEKMIKDTFLLYSSLSRM